MPSGRTMRPEPMAVTFPSPDPARMRTTAGDARSMIWSPDRGGEVCAHKTTHGSNRLEIASDCRRRMKRFIREHSILAVMMVVDVVAHDIACTNSPSLFLITPPN